MMDGSTVTAVTVVLVPWDEAQPLQSMMLAEEGIARRINPDDPINVISSLLIRPAAQQTPGLYVNHEPFAAAAAAATTAAPQSHPNVRATRLAMAYGLFSHRFHCDVIVSRGPQKHLALGDISAACCVTPDLRHTFELAADAANETSSSSTVAAAAAASAVWLGNAARSNYHDAAVLSRLAQVMNRPNISNDSDEADSVCNSDNDENDDDTHDNPKNEDTALTKKEYFVTKVPLCLHCRRPASQLCQGCYGAYFCEPPATCREEGWSHQCLCPTWKVYTERRRELSAFASLGAWCQKLVSRDFQTSKAPYEDFLATRLGVTKEDACSGWWRTEMDGWSGGESKSAKTIDVSIRKSYVDGFYPVVSIPLERHVSADDISDAGSLTFGRNELGLLRLSSWRDYYRLRCISESSPVALLLTFPVTLYHAIVEYGQVPCTVARTILKRSLRIHIVGVEKEMNFLDLFKELSFLLPDDFAVELVFVVRNDVLPPSLRSTSPNKFTVDLTPTLRVVITSGTYGYSLDPNFDCGSGPPDMIMAFNAGLYAYESWRSVVTYLDRHSGVVGVFTDYNEFSGVQCASLGGMASRNSVTMNPFRQPRAMPVYSMNLRNLAMGFCMF